MTVSLKTKRKPARKFLAPPSGQLHFWFSLIFAHPRVASMEVHLADASMRLHTRHGTPVETQLSDEQMQTFVKLVQEYVAVCRDARPTGKHWTHLEVSWLYICRGGQVVPVVNWPPREDHGYGVGSTYYRPPQHPATRCYWKIPTPAKS